MEVQKPTTTRSLSDQNGVGRMSRREQVMLREASSWEDRLTALAEEVGEFAQPPGAAVTVWRARRRRRAVGMVAVGLLIVVIVGLAVPSRLPRWATGQGDLGATQGARTTAGSPATTRSSGPFGPLTVSSVAHVLAPGEQMAIHGEGCFPVEPGTFSVPAMGIRKSVPINGDGSFGTQVVVPRNTKPGTYDVVIRCHITRDTLGQAVDPVVIINTELRGG